MTEGAQRGRQTHLGVDAALAHGASTAICSVSRSATEPRRRPEVTLRLSSGPALPRRPATATGGGGGRFRTRRRLPLRQACARRRPTLRDALPADAFRHGSERFLAPHRGRTARCATTLSAPSRASIPMWSRGCGATAARWSTPSGWVPTAPRRTTASPIASSWVRPCARTSSSGQ